MSFIDVMRVNEDHDLPQGLPALLLLLLLLSFIGRGAGE
jgi:hypothetical protein